jgi:predicted transcriptional regulator
MEEVLTLENRRKIFEFVSKHPGTHMREMERELSMPLGLLSYHLDYMVKRAVLKVEDDGYRKSYFPSDRFHFHDRKTLSLLRQPVPRKIVMHILIQGPSTFNQLLEEMACAKSTLSYHLNRMVRREVLEVEKKERESWYSLRNEFATADLLIALRESLACDAVDRFASVWDQLAKK